MSIANESYLTIPPLTHTHSFIYPLTHSLSFSLFLYHHLHFVTPHKAEGRSLNIKNIARQSCIPHSNLSGLPISLTNSLTLSPAHLLAFSLSSYTIIYTLSLLTRPKADHLISKYSSAILHPTLQPLWLTDLPYQTPTSSTAYPELHLQAPVF